jgi:hypothetical protein
MMNRAEIEMQGHPNGGARELGENAGNPRMEGEQSFSQQIKAKINVPDELREPYERIVIAGQKVLYSEETESLVREAFQGDAPVEQKLAKGIRDLMVLLWQESNHSMPPQLIIPAAVELLTEAADFVNETGLEQVNEQQLGEAMRLMIGMVMDTFGVTQERLQQAQQEQMAGAGGGNGGGNATSPGGPPPGASQGIIARRMAQEQLQ